MLKLNFQKIQQSSYDLQIVGSQQLFSYRLEILFPVLKSLKTRIRVILLT